MSEILGYLLLLALYGSAPADGQRAPPGASYQSKKSLADLQKCLTDKLAQQGNVTAVKIEDTTTLMLREGDDEPMLIDLDPPSVTVTTKFAHGTRKVVEGCI